MIQPMWSKKTINVVNSILSPTMSVYEWGAGFSTIWLARRVREITTMEHSEAWVEGIRELIKETWVKNVTIQHAFFTELLYYNHIETTGKQYDFISVDGRNRVLCFQKALSCLKDGGYILLDDSERERYSGVFNNNLELISKITPADGDTNHQEAAIWKKV